MIQTFPDSFKWDANKTDTEQMIGNAVPVKLAEFVASSLLEYSQRADSLSDKESFLDWLLSEQNYSERAAKDVVSRCKRAEKIVSSIGVPDAYYLFTLEQQPEFQALSVNVKSQMKRALKLQAAFACK